MTTTYTWTTARGANVEMTITVEHITRETVSADGWPVEVNCDRWERTVESCKVNGAETPKKELWVAGRFDDVKHVIIIDRRGGQDVMAEIPAEIAESIYGEEAQQRKAKLDRELAAAHEYEAHREMMRKVMGY